MTQTESTDSDFWHALINTDEAATFLGLRKRALEGFRYNGGGPQFVRISARAIRYRRLDLKAWADSLTATSVQEYAS